MFSEIFGDAVCTCRAGCMLGCAMHGDAVGYIPYGSTENRSNLANNFGDFSKHNDLREIAGTLKNIADELRQIRNILNNR